MRSCGRGVSSDSRVQAFRSGLGIGPGRAYRSTCRRSRATKKRRGKREARDQNHGGDLLFCAQRLGQRLERTGLCGVHTDRIWRYGDGVHDVLLRIAALPRRHALTLNFDTSFEAAHRRSGLPAALLRPVIGQPWPASFVIWMIHRIQNMQCMYTEHLMIQSKRIALTENGYTELYSNNRLFRELCLEYGGEAAIFPRVWLYRHRLHQPIARVCEGCSRERTESFCAWSAFGPTKTMSNAHPAKRTISVDPIFYNVVVDADGHPNHDEFVGIINAISVALDMPEQAPARTGFQLLPLRPFPWTRTMSDARKN